MNQFCFSGGEAIRQERREVDVAHRPKRLDEPGARRPETRRAGRFRAKSFGLRLGRTPGTTAPKPLTLAQNRSGRMVPFECNSL
jgi:hypothetical protein